MKKALSLVLALMMLAVLCTAPVSAGTATNPTYVPNVMSVPKTITIAAHSTEYYKYNPAVFNGWFVSGYGLSAITVDGDVFDEADRWGEITAQLSFTKISPAVVGFVNDSDEEIEVMLTHTMPKGTLENPDDLQDGDNALSIPTNLTEYVSVYYPVVEGDYTFSTEQAADFQITVYTGGSPTDGGIPTVMEGGSLTMTLPSYEPVYVVAVPVGMTGDVVLNVLPPKAGTESNPIWLDSFNVENVFEMDADGLYFNVDSGLEGNTLNITSTGAAFTATINGEEYTSVNGVVSVVLKAVDYAISMVLSGDAGEITFLMEYAAGTMENPIEMVQGGNAVSIPGGSLGLYYFYTAETDGLLTVTPSTLENIGYLTLFNEDYSNTAFLALDEGATSVTLSVSAGEVIFLEIGSAMDEDTWVNMPLDIVLNLTFEGVAASVAGDANGDGNINNRDLGLLQQYLNDWDVTIDLDACDVNDDGNINNRDLGLLQQYLNDWDVVLK